MNIKIEWCENGRKGYLEYDIDKLITVTPLLTFKKVVKLLVRYGTPEVIQNFTDSLNAHRQKLKIMGARDTDKEFKTFQRKCEIWEGLVL